MLFTYVVLSVGRGCAEKLGWNHNIMYASCLQTFVLLLIYA